MTQLLKYKSGKMTALSVIAFTATIVTMLASCDTAQLEIPEVQLTLRLSLPETGEYARTRAITANEENAIDIEQLKVLVFKVEGTSELFAYETPQIQLQANRYTVTLKQSQAEEKYRLVVIANAGKQLPAIQENTPKDEVLRKITFSASGNWNTASPSDYTPFPMWGESTTAQSITSATTLGSITLLRALARIDVGCGLKEETATGVSGFALKTVSIYRTNNKGYAVPVDSKTITDNVVSAVSVPSDAGTNDALTYTCTDDKSLLRTIYIAEAEQGTNKDNNICLVIGGIYTGDTYYYRVDLTVNGSYIPIKRNCRYIVNIKAVNSIGYTTEEEALYGDIVLSVTADLSAEAWGSQTEAGKGTITLL